MNDIEKYLLLFSDTLKGGLIFYISKPYVFYVLGVVEGKNYLLTYILFFTAMISSGCINYLVGYLISYFAKFSEKTPNFKTGEYYFLKYFYFVSFFAFIDIWGAVFCVAAGIFKFQFKKFLSLMMLGNLMKIIYDMYDLKSLLSNLI
jgi:membrane protein YqaA with SNARE-associated domain